MDEVSTGSGRGPGRRAGRGWDGDVFDEFGGWWAGSGRKCCTWRCQPPVRPDARWRGASLRAAAAVHAAMTWPPRLWAWCRPAASGERLRCLLVIGAVEGHLGKAMATRGRALRSADTGAPGQRKWAHRRGQTSWRAGPGSFFGTDKPRRRRGSGFLLGARRTRRAPAPGWAGVDEVWRQFLSTVSAGSWPSSSVERMPARNNDFTGTDT